MFFKTAAAAFFLDLQNNGHSLGELLTMAGMENMHHLSDDQKIALAVHDPNFEVIYGHWGAFHEAWSRLDKLKYHHCLQIYFSMNHYLDLRPLSRIKENFLPLEEDPALPMAYTFRDACERLQPEVAFVDIHAHYEDEVWENGGGSRDWILQQYWMLLEFNANALADEGFALLYLNDYMSYQLDSNPLRDDRDSIPVSQGRLVFARRGWSRWS